MQRHCGRCKSWKAPEAFGPHRGRGHNGRQPWCKSCTREHQRQTPGDKIRKLAQAREHAPIVVIEGDAPPTEKGSPSCYITPSGSVVHSPSVYRRHGGRALFRPSSLRIEVGQEWLEQNVSLLLEGGK